MQPCPGVVPGVVGFADEIGEQHRGVLVDGHHDLAIGDLGLVVGEENQPATDPHAADTGPGDELGLDLVHPRVDEVEDVQEIVEQPRRRRLDLNGPLADVPAFAIAVIGAVGAR